jgi:hypothetical protein
MQATSRAGSSHDRMFLLVNAATIAAATAGRGKLSRHRGKSPR